MGIDRFVRNKTERTQCARQGELQGCSELTHAIPNIERQGCGGDEAGAGDGNRTHAISLGS